MTPDEVVGSLQGIFSYGLSIKQTQALQSAISLIQDYQKLRERIDKGKIKTMIGYVGSEYDQEMTAEQIVTYLQQPTEH